VAATNAPGNGTLAANGDGRFLATGTTAATNSSAFTLNGTTCTTR